MGRYCCSWEADLGFKTTYGLRQSCSVALSWYSNEVNNAGPTRELELGLRSLFTVARFTGLHVNLWYPAFLAPRTEFHFISDTFSTWVVVCV